MTPDTGIKKFFDIMIAKTIVLTMLATTIMAFSLFFFHTHNQEQTLQVEINKRSEALGGSISALIQNALAMGIPFEDLVGVDDFLNGNMESAKELGYMAITDKDGTLYYQTKNFRDSLIGSFKRFSVNSYDGLDKLPVYSVSEFQNIPLRILGPSQELIGYLHMGVSQAAITARVNDVYYDIVTILFVAMVIGFEFLMFIFRNSVTTPLSLLLVMLQRLSVYDFRTIVSVKKKDTIGKLVENVNLLLVHMNERYQKIVSNVKTLRAHSTESDHLMLVDESLSELQQIATFPKDKVEREPEAPIVENLRLPAFLIVFCEAVLVASIPTQMLQFYTSDLFVSKQFITSLPVLVFMVFSFITVLFSSKLSYRVGFQKALLVGILLSGIGYGTCFLSQGLWVFLLGRAVTAAGYGFSYATCQNYAATYSAPEKRIRSYAIFSIALAAGYICGAPVGGILTDNIGFSYIFLFALFLCVLCAAIVRKYIVDFKEKTLAKVRNTKKKPRELFRLRELIAAVMLTGFPVRMAFTGMILIIYPLYLITQLGNTLSTTGRIMMTFGITSFLVSPLAARVVERIPFPKLFSALSGAVVGLSILLNAFFESTIGAIFSLSIFSIGSVVHSISIMAVLEKISVQEFDNHTKGAILSFYFVFERIGMIVAPPLVSVLLTYFSFHYTLTIFGLFILGASLLYLFLLAVDFLRTKRLSKTPEGVSK